MDLLDLRLNLLGNISTDAYWPAIGTSVFAIFDTVLWCTFKCLSVLMRLATNW